MGGGATRSDGGATHAVVTSATSSMGSTGSSALRKRRAFVAAVMRRHRRRTFDGMQQCCTVIFMTSPRRNRAGRRASTGCVWSEKCGMKASAHVTAMGPEQGTDSYDSPIARRAHPLSCTPASTVRIVPNSKGAHDKSLTRAAQVAASHTYSPPRYRYNAPPSLDPHPHRLTTAN